MAKELSKRLPENVFNRIHEDIGQASMCWDRIEKAGIFHSEKASKIAFDLCHFIANELEGMIEFKNNQTKKGV